MKITQLKSYTNKELEETIIVIRNLIKFRKELTKLVKSGKIDIGEVYKKRGNKPKWINEIVKETKKKRKNK